MFEEGGIFPKKKEFPNHQFSLFQCFVTIWEQFYRLRGCNQQ